MMSIFTRDLRPVKSDMLEAIRSFEKDKDFDRFMTEVEVFRSAIPLGHSFPKHCLKLAMAGATDRIVKLVGVIDDRVLRRWVLWPLQIVLWPFILIARIIKLGLP